MKKTIVIRSTDYDRQPDSFKSIYQGTKYPEAIGKRVLNFDGRILIEGIHFNLRYDDKGLTSKIGICQRCKRISLIYSKGNCKSCANAILYKRKDTAKCELLKVKRERKNEIAQDKKFRQTWPYNIIIAISGTHYNQSTFPFKENLSEIISIIEKYGSYAVIAHYRNGIPYKTICKQLSCSRQSLTVANKKVLQKINQMLVMQGFDFCKSYEK